MKINNELENNLIRHKAEIEKFKIVEENLIKLEGKFDEKHLALQEANENLREIPQLNRRIEEMRQKIEDLHYEIENLNKINADLK